MNASSAIPEFVTIGHVPGYRLTTPLTCEVWQEDGFITVWNEDVLVMGMGSHLTDAIHDFQQSLVELRRDLDEWYPNISPHLGRIRTRLHELMEAR